MSIASMTPLPRVEQSLQSGAHQILWTREHVTPYTTNITGEIQTWRPNTYYPNKENKHVAKCYIIITR